MLARWRFSSTNYTEFLNLLSVRKFRGNVFYYDVHIPGSNWIMEIYCLDEENHSIFTCSLSGASDPKPVTFSTDFPNAVQWTNYDVSVAEGYGRWYFRFDQSSGSPATYADFLASISSMQFQGDAFYSDAMSGGTWVMNIYCISDDTGDYYICSLTDSSDPMPGTFATDFPNAMNILPASSVDQIRGR